MCDGPSASCCHSAAHSASASSIVVDHPLIALQHGVEHRGVRLCAADQEEHLRVRRPAGAADLLSSRFAVIVQSAARRFYGIRLREPPENPSTAASARSRAPRLHPQTRFTTRDGFTTYNMAADRSGRMKTGAAGANCPGGSGFCLPVTPKSRSDVRRGPRPQRCR